MRQGKKSILMPTLAAGLMMAWSIAETSAAFAQRGGGRGGGGMSRGGGGGFSRGGGMSRGGSRAGSSFSRGGGPSHGGSSFSHGGSISSGGFSPGGSVVRGSHGYSGYSGGGYSRGGYRGGATPHAYYGGGDRHSRSHFHYQPYHRGYGYYGPGFGIYVGPPLYRHYDYYVYYTTPYYTAPYYNAPYYNRYTLPYVERYGAVDSPPAAPTTSTNGAVIPAAGKAAEFQLQAERAFRERRYEDAARLSSHAIVEDSRNGKLHLFAAQALFALGDFRSAAAAIQQAASLLDRSEWGFVVENYEKFYGGGDYVTQTARLVEFIKENPDASYARFLLGHHYKFLGYNEAARVLLAKAVELESRDRLAAELLTMAGGKAPSTPELAAPESPPAKELVIPGPAPQPLPAAPSDEKR